MPFSQRSFTSPVGGSECSQVGEFSGCVGACVRVCVCVPLAQAPLCLCKPDVESSPSRAVGDRVAAGSRPEKKKKYPVAARARRPPPHQQGRTRPATRSDVGRLAARDPSGRTSPNATRAPPAGKVELQTTRTDFESDALAAWPSGSRNT